MYIAYLDESGGIEDPCLDRSSTPVRTIVTIYVEAARVPALTRDYVALKTKFFYKKMKGAKSLDLILAEVKGAELLNMTRSGSRNKRRTANRFRGELLALLSKHEVLFTARVWVKAHGTTLDDRKTYGYAVQDAARHFNALLDERDASGFIVADSRSRALNVNVAHSVFTQMWRAGKTPLPRVSEVPLFAASDNHAGLQIADLLATTLVFPIATAAFCNELPDNAHNPKKYAAVREDFAEQLKPLLHRYYAAGKRRGGIDVTGMPPGRSSSRFFREHQSASEASQVDDKA